LSRHQYESQFGDLVFSIPAGGLAARSNAEKIAKKTAELKKKLNDVTYIDGEEVENYKKPYIGTTKFLNEFIDDLGRPLFPIFTPEEYWKRRRQYWKDPNQDINEDYDSSKAKGVYTKEEKELIFGDE
jgi:hypothetical protein